VLDLIITSIQNIAELVTKNLYDESNFANNDPQITIKDSLG